jgi:hypothetical protein
VAVGVGDLGQRPVEDLDVIGGGVRSGPAGAQQAGQGLAGRVVETQQRVESVGPLPCLRGQFLVAVANHDRGVHIEYQARDGVPGYRRRLPPTGLAGLRPRHLPCPGPRRSQPGQRGVVESVEEPPHRRCRRDRAEQFGLAAQHRQVSDRLAAISEHHRHVEGDPTRIMPRSALPQRQQRLGHRPGQPSYIGQISEQTGTRVTHHATPIRADDDLRTRASTLHP